MQTTETEPAGGKVPVRPRAVFQSENARVDVLLEGRPLAARWQRGAGMAVDLVAVGGLSLLSGPILGFFSGLTLAALGDRRTSPARLWSVVRWVFIGLGAAVMLLSALLALGRPIVRTAAFDLGRIGEGPVDVAPAALPPAPTHGDLERANAAMEARLKRLGRENERLREAARGSSWVNAAVDFCRTLGLTFGWAGAYFTLFTAWMKGRTPGKALVGTRVVRLDGRPLTGMDAFARYGGYAAGLATGLIGFARLLWEPNRQAIEDKIAGTVVLQER